MVAFTESVGARTELVWVVETDAAAALKVWVELVKRVADDVFAGWQFTNILWVCAHDSGGISREKHSRAMFVRFA